MNYNESFHINVKNSIIELKNKIKNNEIEINYNLNKLYNISNNITCMLNDNYNINTDIIKFIDHIISDLYSSIIKLKKNLNLLKHQLIIYSKEIDKADLLFHIHDKDFEDKLNYMRLLLNINLENINYIYLLLYNIKKNIENKTFILQRLLNYKSCFDYIIKSYLEFILLENFELFKNNEYNHYVILRRKYKLINNLIKDNYNIKKSKLIHSKKNNMCKLICCI